MPTGLLGCHYMLVFGNGVQTNMLQDALLPSYVPCGAHSQSF